MVRPIAVIFLLWLVALTVLSAAAGIEFGEKLLAQVAQLYGRAAREQLLHWQELVAAAPKLTEVEKLARVNAFFNRVRSVEDDVQWGKPDYWATPFEFLVVNGGDCEDFAIAKYFTLREMGVPDDKLRITYVKAFIRESGSIQAHMVLAYYDAPEAEPLILDNRVGEIKPAGARRDLTPTYAFNGAGLWNAKERGRGNLVDGAERIARWGDLLRRMSAERVVPYGR